MYRNADLEQIELPADRIEDGFVYRAFVNKGSKYRLDGELVSFIDDCGKAYCGLLDENGGPLAHGEPVVFLWFSVYEADAQ